MGVTNLILNRGNDLNEFFWPLIYYIKYHLAKDGQIPLWNNLFFSGTPLFPDPQNPALYPLNFIFLFLNIDLGIIVSLIFHFIVGGVGAYFLSRNLKISTIPSLVVPVLFSLSPKYFSYLEAGHLGMIFAWAYLPWLFLSTSLLVKKQNLKFFGTFLVSSYFIYVNHPLLFAFAIGFNLLFAFFIKINTKTFALVHIILAVFLSPIIIPQLSWLKDTTRQLLISSPETYPVWNGKREFLKNLFIVSRDTEKNISFGIVTLILGAWGFFKLKKRLKIAIGITLGITVLIALNNTSPIYQFLVSQNWFSVMRVSTRMWPILILGVSLLAGRGLDLLIKRNEFFAVIALAAILENVYSGYFIMTKNYSLPNRANDDLISYLAKDNDIFRVFCTTRCISQKQAALNNLELAEGYGTFQQKNYYDISQQMMQGFWREKYTLAIPPFEIYLHEKLQPSAEALTALRVKYVISPYDLSNPNLSLIKQSGVYKLYENRLYKRPDYEIYTPNFVRVKVNESEDEIIIPEIYNNFWRAYLNGEKEVEVEESDMATRKVRITEETNFVDFKYEPWRQ